VLTKSSPSAGAELPREINEFDQSAGPRYGIALTEDIRKILRCKALGTRPQPIDLARKAYGTAQPISAQFSIAIFGGYQILNVVRVCVGDLIMERRTAITSWFKWFRMGLGVFWKGSEIAHNCEYMKQIVLERVGPPVIIGYLAHLPPLALVLFGCAWVVLFEVTARRGERAKAKPLPSVQPEAPLTAEGGLSAQVDVIRTHANEIIVRRTFTKIECEIVVRK